MQSPKWKIHFDHPWSKCVKEDGAPIRLHLWTPWGFIMAGEKSQVYDRRNKKYLDRWTYVTFRPNREDLK